ncbi:MAG: hypothetical protein QOE31_1678 [Solirubrobacteraceae bacterium]|nr:hypothetical protein [Solirubrobacteraceae bacterium]
MRALAMCAAAFGWAPPIASMVAGAALPVAVIAANQVSPLAVLAVLVMTWIACGGYAIVHLGERREASATRAGIDLAGETDVAQLGSQAAIAVDAAKPDEVRITLGSGVSVEHEDGRSVLIIGACWLTASSRAELTVAVAHALASHRAGTGSRSARRLDEQLRRAANLVAAGRSWRLIWGSYARTGMRLRDRARERERRWADIACARAYGLERLDGYLRAAFRQDRFERYWVGDVEPCLSEGFAPPILAGWGALLARPGFRQALADDLAAAGLTRRSEAVRAWASTGTQPAGGPIELTLPVGRLERDLLAATYPDTRPRTLVEIEWNAVPGAVWMPRLRRHAAEFGAAIAPFAARDLVAAIGSAGEDDDGQRAYAVAVLLAIALVQAGWTLDVQVGEEIELHHDERSVLPVSLCLAAAGGAVEAAEWAAFAEDSAIADLVVGPPAADRIAAPGAGERWSPPVAVPARSTVVLELARPPGRVRSTIYLAIAVLLGLATGIAFILVAAAAPTPAGAIGSGAFGTVVLVVLGALLKLSLPTVYATGTLTISADRIRIEHPGLLKEPYELAHGNLRAVLVDDALPSGARFAVNASAFPAHGAAPHIFVWVRDQEAVVPCLAGRAQDPNIALLLEQPVRGPRPRRVTSTGPMPGEALTGLLLCVADADAARAAFKPWDLMRPALYDDAAHLGRGFVGSSHDAAASSPTD